MGATPKRSLSVSAYLRDYATQLTRHILVVLLASMDADHCADIAGLAGIMLRLVGDEVVRRGAQTA